MSELEEPETPLAFKKMPVCKPHKPDSDKLKEVQTLLLLFLSDREKLLLKFL